MESDWWGKTKTEEMITDQWAPPCNSRCTEKYATLMKIPWRIFCKKGCDADGETLEDCLGECDEICYKDPVLENQQWSAYIDRSPGSVSYSQECFRACVSGCGYKFDVPWEKINQVHARETAPPAEDIPTPTAPPAEENPAPTAPKWNPTKDEMPNTSA